MASLYKKYLYSLVNNVFTYLLGGFFSLFIVIRFFIVNSFFNQLGNTDFNGFFNCFPYVCIFVIPALTAIVSSTKKEEYSYPVSDYILPIAKILALLTVFAVPFVISFIVPISVCIFGNIDVSSLICGYFGILLYIVLSFCVSNLIFTMISNKGIGFLITAVVLLTFNVIHAVALYTNLNSFFGKILQFLSFSWHFNSFSKGILDSRDIWFYLITIVLFYFLTVVVIRKNRGDCTTFGKKLNILMILTCVLGLVVSSRMYFKIDTSKTKKYSVSKYSKSLLKDLDSNLVISYYLSPELKNLYPQVKEVNDYLIQYASISKKVVYKQYDASSEMIQNMLQIQNIPYQTIDTSSKGKSVTTQVYSAIVMNYLGRNETIPFVLMTDTLEYDLTSRLQYLSKNHKRAVKVLVGNDFSNSDYNSVKLYLEAQGFSVDFTYLPFDSDNYSKDEPLIILGTSNFTKTDSRRFVNYILGGGKAFVASQPYTIDIQNNWDVIPQDFSFFRELFTFGIYFNDSICADISNFQLPMYSDTNQDGTKVTPKTEYVNYSLWPILPSQSNALNGMTLFWPTSMTLDKEVAEMEDFNVVPSLVTTNQAWEYKKYDGRYFTNPFVVPKTPDSPEEKQQQIVAASVYKKSEKSPSLIVLGDQYTLSSPMLNYTAGEMLDIRSLEYMCNSLLELNNETQILSIKNKSNLDTSLTKLTGEKFYKAASTTLFLNIVIPVLIYFGVGIYFVIRRKNFNK